MTTNQSQNEFVYIGAVASRIIILCYLITLFGSIFWGTRFGGTAWLLLIPISPVLAVPIAAITLSIMHIGFNVVGIFVKKRFAIDRDGTSEMILLYAISFFIVFGAYLFLQAPIAEAYLGGTIFGFALLFFLLELFRRILKFINTVEGIMRSNK